MSYFKIAIMTIFTVSTVAGVIIFALSKSSSGVGSVEIVVWGTIAEDVFNTAYSKATISTNSDIRISYTRKDQVDFDTDFVEALSEGRGPDVVILRDDLIYKNRNKLLTIPYKNYTERTFKDTFIEEGELFLSPDGVLAVPFSVDPMVMYWNRDLFGTAQVSQPPKYWEELYPIVDKLTKKNSSGDVLQSAVAFGEWRNITNAKEIVSMLLLQAGTPITSRTNGTVASTLNFQFGQPRMPSQSAIDFYTQFSNPTNSLYTWNRSLPSSLNSFLAGNLAMYFGFASELFGIQQKNSNLNFDVTYVPQTKGTKKSSVFGRMNAFAIVKQSKQIPGSFMFINSMTEKVALKALEDFTGLPPVRRDMLAIPPADAAERVVFYNSALISHSWIDPNPSATSIIFRDMIESITSGKSRTSEALSRANSQLDAELR